MRTSIWLTAMLVIALAASSCSENGGGGSSDSDTDMDTDTDADSDADSDTDADTDTDADECSENLDHFEGDQVYAESWLETIGEDEVPVTQTSDIDISDTDDSRTMLGLKLIGGQVETVDLSTQASWETCERCVQMPKNCVLVVDQVECEQYFHAVEGTLDVTEINVAEPWTGSLDFAVQDIVLRELEVDNDLETIIGFKEGGDTICIEQ